MKLSFSYIVERTSSILAAIILLQTLFFKFSAAPESVYIFETMGMEPWGRISTGIVELIAGLLLLSRAFSGVGALLSLGVMSGAVLSHLFVLGIEVQGDGGWLFTLAVAVSVSNLITLVLRRTQLRSQLGRFLPFLK
jgi:hypothetical protein